MSTDGKPGCEAFAAGRKRAQRGFTLIELLVVVALLALLTLGMYRVNLGYSSWQLRFAAEAIANEIEYARVLAQTEQRTTQVDFSTNQVQVRAGSSHNAAVRSTYLLPKGCSIHAAGDRSIRFTAMGRVFSGSSTDQTSWSTTLVGRDGERFYIVVAVNSGRVSIRSNRT